MGTGAIVLAAGEGRRMGADKALLELGGITAIERVVQTCGDAGVDRVVVVRAEGAGPLPEGLDATTVTLQRADMAATIRKGRSALTDAEAVAVIPVDHALVAADTVAALLAMVRDGAGIALPLWRERAGHPVAFAGTVLAEIETATTLRDVVARDRSRVRALPCGNPWVVRDLDTPQDLEAARAWLDEEGWPVRAQMHRHRSRRKFRSDPVPDDLVARLVDAARHASTSSFIQATSVVVVRDPSRRAECARLCGDQPHIAEAPVFLAMCADLSRIALACDDEGTGFAAGDLELFVQATVDAALVGQNLQLAAEAAGLGSCMIGGARNHPEELAALLGLPRHSYVVFGVTLGVAADDPVSRDRLPIEGVLHVEDYDPGASEEAARAADDLQRAWARRVNAAGAGPEVNEAKGWRDRMARIWRPDGRYVLSRSGLGASLRRLGMLGWPADEPPPSNSP